MSSYDYSQDAADTISTLAGATPAEIRGTLNQYDLKSQIAGTIANLTGGGGGGGGSSWQRVATVRWFDFVNIYVSIPTTPGGTFTLTANEETTAPIAGDASFADILAALQALPGIGADGAWLYDENNGGYAFTLGLLDSVITGDASGLTDPAATILVTGGVAQGDYPAVWPTDVTITAGQIIDNAICLRTTPFDVDEIKARLTDAANGGTSGAPAWSAPYAQASSVGSGWSLTATDAFTNFAGVGNDTASSSRLGAQQVSYSSDDVTGWYVTLPAYAKTTTPLYLVVEATDANSDGQADFLLKIEHAT